MRRTCAGALIALAITFAAGCGAQDFPNNPRPASSVELSAKVDDHRVTVAPNEVGAGLAQITISNQSSDNVTLDLSGPSKASTAEIAAGSVGTLRVELKQGDYSVQPNVASIQSGDLSVGPDRPSAQNDLLLP